MKKEVIGVDLGGTNLRVALVKNNKIIRYIKKETPKTKDEIINELSKGIGELITKETQGIGIASPGPIKNGIIGNTPNIALRNFNLKKEIKKRFKIKVVVENDANCVALAEAKFGCKKKNFFIITLGTGIGGGVIINGELFRGSNGYGGELGHIILDNGKDFEFYCGWKRIKEVTIEKFGTSKYVSELVAMNNKEAHEILDEISEYLGQGIASLINVFDPEVIIIAGGVRESGNKFLKLIREKTQKYVFVPWNKKMYWSKLDHPGILGASILI
ncbi:MAG: ROK family protein [Candidatus Pacearchaeota archaeon]